MRSGVTLAPTYSVLTDAADYRAARHNTAEQSDRCQPVLQRFAHPAGIRWHGLPGASGHLGRDRAQPDLQPDTGRDGGRGQQLDQHQLGSAGDDEPVPAPRSATTRCRAVRRPSTTFRPTKLSCRECRIQRPTSSATRGQILLLRLGLISEPWSCRARLQVRRFRC